MSAQITIATWILPDNLFFFLQRVSDLIGYHIANWDWDAIRFGTGETNLQQDRWYEYTLMGELHVKLAFGKEEETKRLYMRAEAQEHIAAPIEALAQIMQLYKPAHGTQNLERLIGTAFVDTSVPEQRSILARFLCGI